MILNYELILLILSILYHIYSDALISTINIEHTKAKLQHIHK